MNAIPQQPQSQGQGPQPGTNWLIWIIRSLAVSVEVFLHRDFGERYIGLQGLLAILLMILFAGSCPHQDPSPLLWFAGAFVLFCLAHRADVLRRHRRGQLSCHSRYTGRPCLLRFLLRRFSERAVKGFEPVFVFFIGILLLGWNQPLGAYLMVAAVALLICVNMATAYERTRAIDINDAVIEQISVAERFRDARR